MAKILIIGINYRPEATGIAPYTTDLAEHLAARGHRVTVITGFPHYPAWRLGAGERRFRATEDRDGVRVLRRRHYVPRAQSALRRAVYEVTFLVHGAISRPGRPDAVIGIIPSLSGGMLARFFATVTRRPYALVFQDVMAPAARQSGIGGGGSVAGTTAALERWCVRKASIVVIASESFRPYLLSIGVAPERTVTLPNWAHVGRPSGDRGATRRRLGWPTDQVVVLHAGNMGLKQGLEQVVEAAQRAEVLRHPILYVLMGEGSQRAALERQTRRLSTLRFEAFQSEAELADVLAAADVLLVSERSTVIDMSLPSKLTSYMAAGRPILAAVAPSGATANEVRRAGAGVVVPSGDPEGLNDAVLRLHADVGESERLGAAGQRYARSALDLSVAHARIDGLLDRLLEAPASRRADERFDVLGTRLEATSFDAAVSRILGAPDRGERLAVHFATAHTLVEAAADPGLRDALAAGLVEPDGMPLVWLGRLGGVPVQRVCGPDFMPALLHRGVPLGRKHYFYGGAPGVPEALADRLRQAYPGLDVVGTYSPPFRALTEEEERDAVEQINRAAPDYVWVGLGTPKQDLWIAEHRDRLEASAVLAVGAAFDFLSGKRNRAPRWMQRSGLEWIYRLASEPRRLWVRYTRVNARFLRLLLREQLARRRAG